MSILQVSVAPAPGVSVSISPNIGAYFVDVVYIRVITSQAGAGVADLPSYVRETVRASLDERLSGSFELDDVAPNAPLDLGFLGGNGAVKLHKSVSPGGGATFVIELGAQEVAAITAPDPQAVPAPPQISRRAYFVSVGEQRTPFEQLSLHVAPVQVGNGGWKKLGLDQIFHSNLPLTSAVQCDGEPPAGWGSTLWTSYHLAVDGQFVFTVPLGAGDAWIWWLSGPIGAIGIVIDDLSVPRVTSMGVALPPLEGVDLSADGPVRIPVDLTEAEVATNPQIYTEDPGEFCKPFKNPERVLGERSFYSILRVEQPVISSQSSVQIEPLPMLTYNPLAGLGNTGIAVGPPVPAAVQTAPIAFAATPPPAHATAGTLPTTAAASIAASVAAASLQPTVAPVILSGGNTAVVTPPPSTTAAGSAAPLPGSSVALPLRPLGGTIIDNVAGVTFVRHALPVEYVDSLRRVSRGRTELDANNPIQWEADISRYQAATVARGHILEFRMRWRSNGYSLGTVAKTLTLAPRQTKRIQKIEWRRSELARRTETTRLTDQVSDTVTRNRSYDDAVQANLSEWARGQSEASTAAAAGGFGLALDGFVVGGGGGGSNASSSSSQEGGRRTSASEEQQLRDAIRRYGDSLRRLDSMVVNEVTQEETATGTTEIIRNANYGHSLTVIYYQILRHLKIETAVAGVRECLFVPFAITPFTVPRAYRWREFLQRGLRDPQYGGAIKYLKDVQTNFAGSDIPPGRRSDQPVRYIFGSLFLKLAIDRPRDKDDGSFDASTWVVMQPHLGSPAQSIFLVLKAAAEAQRDALFQQHHAPAIAANWVQTLRFEAGGVPLVADFRLATTYRFNTVARVDFSIAVNSGMPVTRETLQWITITASRDLSPGSIANVESLTFTYETDHFKRQVSASQGAGDLVTVETGGKTAPGATIFTIPDEWERRDVRAEIVNSVQSLIEHLNEHVEYYTKWIWGNMDHDRLFMLLDGFYVPGTNHVSIASVVERDPIAIVGNCIVFRVSAGSFLGIGNITTPAELFNHYVSLDAPSEPILISLPTDGLYAQTIMDECAAIEEHFGGTDWVLNDPDPALGEIAPELLLTRRAEPQGVTPSPLPQTLINLPNAPDAPAPSGLAGALAAVTTANAFRDMAGLAGTQANAAAALQTAAGLANSFGSQAAALKLAEIAKSAHDAQSAPQKIATVQQALQKGLTTPDIAQQHTNQILDSLHAPTPSLAPHQDPSLQKIVPAVLNTPGGSMRATTSQGSFEIQGASATLASFPTPGTQMPGSTTTPPMPMPGTTPPTAAFVASAPLVLAEFINQDVIYELQRGGVHPDPPSCPNAQPVPQGVRTVTAVHFPRLSSANQLHHFIEQGIQHVFPTMLKDVGNDSYQVPRKLRIVYPADPANPGKVAGTGRLPVVAMIHGSHDPFTNSGTEIRSFEGYGYLQDYLAQNGIVSVSVDTNVANSFNSWIEMRAQMLLSGLDRMRDLDQNSQIQLAGVSVDSPLFGRLDFSRVGLMGHSRGGDAVVAAVLDNKARGDNSRFGIRAVCSLAPTDFTGTANLVGFANDVMDFRIDCIPDLFRDGPNTLNDDGQLGYLVLYGGLDGDVKGQDGALGDFGTGFRHYDRATCPKAMVFLHHCGHNRFNTVWKSEPTGADESGLSAADRDPQTGRLLPDAAHRDLANDYIGGFMRWRLNGEDALAGLFNGILPNSRNAEATLQWSFGIVVKNLEDMENPGHGSIASRSVVEGTIDQFANIQIGGVDQKRRTLHQTGVLAVNPNLQSPTPSVLRLDFLPRDRDWSQFDSLAFRVTANFDLLHPDANLQLPGPLPQFSVLLRDAPGNVAQLDQTAFNPPLTRPLFHQLADGTNVTALKLQTVRAPLTSFQGVDPKTSPITSLEIHPGPNFPNHMFFDSFELFKEK
jgi:hypothetical protein